MYSGVTKYNPVIAWWSGGITSAITCKICIDWFGKESVRVVMIDTNNEDPDTYRFKADCQSWYGRKIESITNAKYERIEEVWYRSLSLNVATGAICSTELKRVVRQQFQKDNRFSYQAFGFDTLEIDRAKAMKKNNPDARPIFPLIQELLTKKDCLKIVEQAGIEVPQAYHLGYSNNNCLQTGCVQGGIGYWQKIAREEPAKFDKMALVEHELTDMKGEPVTMLKDQGKDGGLVFLKPHPMYPFVKDISNMRGREPKPLLECNGFCGTNDLRINSETEMEINFARV